MSPNVGNFVHDLVEMAKAMETLPQVEHERDQLKAQLDAAQTHNQGLEQNIISYKEEIERLQSKVRATEAERDDAELRFLDLEEKSAKVVRFLAQIEGMAVQAEVTLVPPKPQPEPEPQPQPSIPEAVHSIEPDWKQDQAESSVLPPQQQGQGEAAPTSSPTSGETGATSMTDYAPASSEPASSAPQPPASQGQGEVNPSANTGQVEQAVPLEPVQNTDVGSTSTETSSAKPAGPYTGKRYYGYPHYVSLPEWEVGGGTFEDYNWRPSQW